MSIVTTDNRFYSEIAAAIREKNGESTLYLPADMAEAILAIKGGGEAFAAISVTYPEGSVCTCTQPGQTPLTAGDTSGAWLFFVPVGGEWTIACTDGERTASSMVEITAAQAASIELLYAFYLFDNEHGGSVNTDITGGFTILKSSGSSCLVTEEYIRIRNTDTSSHSCRVMTANALSMSKYSKICFAYTRTGTGKVMFGASKTNTSGDRTADLPIAVTSTAAAPELTVAVCPINSSDNYYIGVSGRTTSFDVSIFKMWLE